MAVKLGDALLYLGADDDQLKKDLNGAEGKVKGWGATMTGLLQGFGMGIFNAVSGAIGGAFETIGESISLASDLSETVSKVRTLFGDSSAAIEDWASGAASNLGMTKQAALDAIGTIGNLFLQLGASNETAAATSQTLVQLATDLGSFHNADPSEILDSMSAAFRGEYDSLQKYVPMINAANVEQRALADTGKAAASELTALDKATAAYELTVEGAGAATGDFARTSDGWANTMKTLNSYWQEFKTLMGETLLPVLTPIVAKVKELAEWALPLLADYIHENVIPAIEAWADNFDSWWADHAQPFLDDVQELWGDFIEKTQEAMGDTEAEFGANMETLKAIAQVAGEEIGKAIGENLGVGLQAWWDANWAQMWNDFWEIPAPRPGSIADTVLKWINGGTPTAPALQSVAPSLAPGSGLNPYAAAQAITINNYVDATTRGTAEAARDGTLDGLRQAGMR